jgi:hypothetical protein
MRSSGSRGSGGRGLGAGTAPVQTIPSWYCTEIGAAPRASSDRVPDSGSRSERVFAFVFATQSTPRPKEIRSGPGPLGRPLAVTLASSSLSLKTTSSGTTDPDEAAANGQVADPAVQLLRCRGVVLDRVDLRDESRPTARHPDRAVRKDDPRRRIRNRYSLENAAAARLDTRHLCAAGQPESLLRTRSQGPRRRRAGRPRTGLRACRRECRSEQRVSRGPL